MKNLSLIVFVIAIVIGCNFPFMDIDAPPDFHPIHGDSTLIDSIGIDTLPIDTILVDTLPVDTTPICTFPEEIQEPQFCQAYHEITDLVQTDRVIIIGNHSAVITSSNTDELGTVIDSLFELYKPQYTYKTYVNPDDPRTLITMITGTNDRQQFYLNAQIRYNGWKHFFGFDTKSLFPFGVLTPEQHLALIEEFPSIYRFNFIRTQYSEATYPKLSLAILGDCKKGDWADFRFNPFPIPDSIPIMFEDAHWNTVLHGPEQNNTIDLRSSGPMLKPLLTYDARHQIIMKDFNN